MMSSCFLATTENKLVVVYCNSYLFISMSMSPVRNFC